MQRIITWTLTLLLFTITLPAADAERVERVHYLPSIVVVGISCSGERHDWVPSGTPDPEDPYSLPGWAVSGEPECAPNDLRNQAQGTNDAGGFGAAAFTIMPGDVSASVTTDDEVFGPDDSWLRVRAPESASTGESATSEGCGPQFVAFPDDMHSPWAPYVLLWAFVDEVGVEDDLSRVCFATTGWIEATIA